MALNVRQINQQGIMSILGSPNDSSTSNSVIGILKRLHSSSTVNGETIEEVINELDDLQEQKANKSETYTKTEVNNALDLKADKSTTYTKTEIDNEFASISSQLNEKANQSTTYTKTQVDNALASKANQSTTYTKIQVDDALATKANQTQVDNALALKADQSTTYTKTQVNEALALKADQSTTYTKTQVDNLITGSAISNYVTTDTLQTITGTKIFTEAHATNLYGTNLHVNTHKFDSVAAVSGDSSSGNNTLCTKTYIDNQIANNANFYPNSYFSLDAGFTAGFTTCSINYNYLNSNNYTTTILEHMDIFYYTHGNNIYISGISEINFG